MNIQALKAWLCLSLLIVSLLNTGPLLAQRVDATFEIGTAALPATTTALPTTQSPFTRITFAAPFAAGTTPNVFPMTPEFGAGADNDPCTIRIRNISNTGFDAACLEPINEDRDGPAVNFNYIAMINGTLNVPLAAASGTVRFESQCSFVNAQVFGPQCDNCTLRPDQNQSFVNQNFLTSFNATPALLTQISTTNNAIQGGGGQPGGEPEFLEAAVQSNSLNASNFNWTLDRLEAGNGNLNGGETICYLAVERDGCQELDFSSLGGPASIDFTAVFGGNVDGEGNGASSGEGAAFPAGCFSNTPTVIGGARSRNGNNGGILRLVSENSAEAIFTFDEDRVSDGERNHIDELISALAFSSTFTTPVTLSKARIEQRGRRTTFEWETSSETFHLGFHLWGETASGWQQLNNRLILGADLDTAQTRRYKRTIKLDRGQQNEISRFGISTIDNTGFEEFYGPFELNTDYGEDANNEPVDWTATRDEFEKNMRARGFVKKGQRWRRVSDRVKQRLVRRQLGANSSVINLEFDNTGIHNISAQSILELAPNWQGTTLNDLAVTLNGKAVPRDIVSDDNLLNADDNIIINVRELDGQDAVYLKTYTYQLRLDRSRAQTAGNFDGSIEADSSNSNNELSTAGMMSVTATSNKIYSAALKANEPWYDSRVLSRGAPASADYTISFTNPIDDSRGALIDFSIFGGIDLPGNVDDHHVQVSVNGRIIDDVTFDGLAGYQQRVELPVGLVTQNNNVVSITVVGDTGLFADLISVDDVTLSAPEFLQNRPFYDFFATDNETAYNVSLANPNLASVYAYTNGGLLTRVKASVTGNSVNFSTLPGQDNLRSDLRFSVAQNRDLPKPSDIQLADIRLQHAQVGDLVIVAHPNFIDEPLQAYAEFKRDNGYTVSVVDWLELVETYGYGNNTPKALNNFLSQALPLNSSQAGGLKNVLIVGGHTYDYLGNLNENIVNFIPTHYRQVSIFKFTPSDNVFADLGNDSVPDLAIGRWPVRTPADLTAIIKKTKNWQSNRDATPYQDALLIAQPSDSNNLNFTKLMDMRLGTPLSRLDDFDNVSRISMQELNESGQENPIEVARDTITSRINDGLELLSFSGHGSLGSWGFQGVVNTDFVKNLSNQGKPTVVMPLACYTSNYEHPSVNTLAHQWLFAGDKGAAAIHGASVLGEYRENSIFAERYLNNTATSKTIGEAIFKAKNEMASGNQMLHNWAYLGDPTLPLR